MSERTALTASQFTAVRAAYVCPHHEHSNKPTFASTIRTAKCSAVLVSFDKLPFLPPVLQALPGPTFLQAHTQHRHAQALGPSHLLSDRQL